MLRQFKKLLSNPNVGHLQQALRMRRIQRRQPIAVFKDFKEASDAHSKKNESKIVEPTQPTHKPTTGFENQKLNRNPIENNRVQKKSDVSKSVFKQKTTNAEQSDRSQETYEKLQEVANRVYTARDPYYENETLTEEIAEEIIENVDYEAEKVQKKIYEYIDLPDGDVRFGQKIQTAKSIKHRYETKSILLEGKRLIKDAFDSGLQAS
jgi:hypothetical protein